MRVLRPQKKGIINFDDFKEDIDKKVLDDFD